MDCKKAKNKPKLRIFPFNVCYEVLFQIFVSWQSHQTLNAMTVTMSQFQMVEKYLYLGDLLFNCLFEFICIWPGPFFNHFPIFEKHEYWLLLDLKHTLIFVHIQLNKYPKNTTKTQFNYSINPYSSQMSKYSVESVLTSAAAMLAEYLSANFSKTGLTFWHPSHVVEKRLITRIFSPAFFTWLWKSSYIWIQKYETEIFHIWEKWAWNVYMNHHVSSLRSFFFYLFFEFTSS